MSTLASALRSLSPSLPRPARVYVDANIPAGAIVLMRRQLHWDVLAIVEHDDLRRLRDRDHFARALDLERTLITLDRDFLDDAAFPPALSPGVVVCSAADERILARLLVHLDETVFERREQDQPLRGRKIWVTASELSLGDRQEPTVKRRSREGCISKIFMP